MSAEGEAYHWLCPDLDQGATLVEPDGLAVMDLRRGSWVSRVPDAPPVFMLDTASDAAPHWIGDRIPLVSERLLGAFKRAGIDNFQTFPVLLSCAGREWPGYVAFNVIGLVDGADSDASVGTLLTEEDPGPRLVQYSNLVLASARTRDLGMFRLADSPNMLLVHDRVMRVLAADTPDEGWGFTAIEIELR
jgi:hypothetical protein